MAGDLSVGEGREDLSVGGLYENFLVNIAAMFSSTYSWSTSRQRTKCTKVRVGTPRIKALGHQGICELAGLRLAILVHSMPPGKLFVVMHSLHMTLYRWSCSRVL